MSITSDSIRTEIEKQSYKISLHADDERIADGLTWLGEEKIIDFFVLNKPE